MKRKNIHPYLSPELYAQFKAYCKRINATESSVIGSALKEYFDDSTDMKLLLRRLDRLGRHATRLERDINAIAEAFAVFVQLWFAHTPSIGENEKDAARREAWNQYQKFVEYVATQMAGGHRFIDDLVQDTIADEDELHQAVRNEEN